MGGSYMAFWTFSLLGLSFGYDCQFSTPDGVTYDLSALAHDSPPDYSVEGSTDFFEYRANVCRPVFQSCAGDFTGIATQWKLQGSCVAIIGRENPEFGGLDMPSFDYIDGDNPAEGVSLTYKNGDLCDSVVSFERKVRYNIRCDKSSKGTLVSASEPEECLYVLEFLSKSACLPSSANNKPKIPKSRATLILLGLTAVLGLYCGLGIYFNRKYNGTGLMESIPHKEFWVELPGLVRDGLAFTIMKVRSFSSSSGDDRVPI